MPTAVSSAACACAGGYWLVLTLPHSCSIRLLHTHKPVHLPASKISVLAHMPVATYTLIVVCSEAVTHSRLCCWAHTIVLTLASAHTLVRTYPRASHNAALHADVDVRICALLHAHALMSAYTPQYCPRSPLPGGPFLTDSHQRIAQSCLYAPRAS